LLKKLDIGHILMDIAKIKTIIKVLVSGNKDILNEAKEKYLKKHDLDEVPTF
jgi:hypothetical protein